MRVHRVHGSQTALESLVSCQGSSRFSARDGWQVAYAFIDEKDSSLDIATRTATRSEGGSFRRAKSCATTRSTLKPHFRSSAICSRLQGRGHRQHGYIGVTWKM